MMSFHKNIKLILQRLKALKSLNHTSKAFTNKNEEKPCHENLKPWKKIKHGKNQGSLKERRQWVVDGYTRLNTNNEL